MIVVLAGGVGGARLARGILRVVGRDRLTVIVNTADDFEHLGLVISPDLDTVMYTLAGLENPSQGWGLTGETWSFMAAIAKLGGETWFRLGDRDLATHVERTRRLAAGATSSEVTSQLCAALGIAARIMPMSDDRVRTIVHSDAGTLSFQDYFVRLQCAPRIHSIEFDGAAEAAANPAALAAMSDPALEAIVLAPSNPFVSVAPIFAIADLAKAVALRAVPLVAICPIVGGKAVKGPAAKMMAELGQDVSALGVARHYRGLIDALVIDNADREAAAAIRDLGLSVHVTDTIMADDDGRRRLAAETLAFAAEVRADGQWRTRGPID
jgi:LPPG:FO 2-phospho-L-lactate transferase